MGKSENISSLKRTSLLEHIGQIGLEPLQVRVSANMLLLDVDIWYGPLAVHLLEGLLDFGSIVYR